MPLNDTQQQIDNTVDYIFAALADYDMKNLQLRIKELRELLDANMSYTPGAFTTFSRFEINLILGNLDAMATRLDTAK